MYYIIIPEPLLVRDKFIAFTDMKIYAITYNNFLCSNHIKTEILKYDGDNEEDVFNIINTARLSEDDRAVINFYRGDKSWAVEEDNVDTYLKFLGTNERLEYFKLQYFDGVISNKVIHEKFETYLYNPERLRKILYNLYGTISNSIIAATLPYIRDESNAITKLELLMNQSVKNVTAINKTNGIMGLLNRPEGSDTKVIWEHLDVKYFYTWYMKRLLKIQ